MARKCVWTGLVKVNEETSAGLICQLNSLKHKIMSNQENGYSRLLISLIKL